MENAEAALRALAQLHARSWSGSDDAYPTTLPRWTPRPLALDRWRDRLVRASERFPEILTPILAGRLSGLPERVAYSLDQLRRRPVSWMQIDAHLDNVLFRPDGTAVLLDWCNAAIGPPVWDLGRFLSEGVDAESRPLLVSAYVDELQETGIETTQADVMAGLRLVLPPLIQSAVGWAGRGQPPSDARSAEVCRRWLRSVVSWGLARDDGAEIGRNTP
jgi:aminoglycoside phosphotransferase (APT) family kinase protein